MKDHHQDISVIEIVFFSVYGYCIENVDHYNIQSLKFYFLLYSYSYSI